MKALVVTNHLAEFAGSEIVAVEVAEALRTLGCKVDLFANYIDSPMKKEILALGLRATDQEDFPNPFDYDVVWCQHNIVALLLSGRQLPDSWFTYFVFCHLSPYEPIETPGIVLEEILADCVMANSPETQLDLFKLGIDNKLIKTFYNAAPSKFIQDIDTSSNLHRLLLVSNHLPEEIKEASNLAKALHGIDVRYIGREGEVKRVTPKDIRDADAVVTIGKTVQYTILAGRPVYCYDQFGGPGWILPSNLDLAEAYNFSGRCCNRKIGVVEICSEWISKYNEATSLTKEIKTSRQQRYTLEHYLSNILELADAKRNSGRPTSLPQKRKRQGLLAREGRLAVVTRRHYRNHHIIAKRAKDLASKVQAQAVQVGALEAKLRAQTSRVGDLEARLAAGEARIQEVKPKLSARERDIQQLKKSTSWGITKPLRAVSRGLRWLLRNTRRALMLAWWLSTGQFSRAAKASLPYYQRYMPLRVKVIIPDRVRKAVKRRLMGDGISLPRCGDSSLRKAIAYAETASNTQDWPEAENRWRAAPGGFGDNAAVANRAKLNLSVGKWLSNIDTYRDQIAEYVKGRATKALEKKGDTKKIVIYTAISGGYDSIKLPEKLDRRFDYVLFTDMPAPDTAVWQVRPVTYFHEDKTRIARFVKTHPHMLLQDYDIAIWIDANIIIQGDIHPLVEEFLASAKAVAAVPHPNRKSIYEELEACIQRKKENPETMKEQIAHYRQAGFDHGDLIESNLMMFNLRDERVRPFLDAWWTEIDRFSKRDQSSLNYALKQDGVDWHRLIERPNSVRNHPSFVIVPHDTRDGRASRLLDALELSFIDPYAGPSYADVRDERIAAQKNVRIDIVVCVHNALEDVQLCLESVHRTRNGERQRLIIIDDGSDQSTARYLEEFARNAPWIELHRNEHARGYTKAANQGLSASIGELVILLNSDTIVTDGWAEKMADAVFSTPGAGIVGPMSNAASHQSIPEHRSSKDQTAVNDLPPGLTAEDMNRYCEQWTAAHVLPRVPLVHGFCFGVTREAIDRIGFFDEGSFPNGYGEENDYCVRAVDAGFGIVIATHTYVFHAKSKSYAALERVALMKAGSEALRRLHGRARIQRSVRSMQENPILVDLRQRAWSLTKCGTRPNNLIISPPAGDRPTETASHPATAAVPESNSGKRATTINLAGYDFLDFGCGAGGSIELGRIRFGGRRGLGLDNRPEKVAAAREAGYDAEVCDVTSLMLQPDSVRFVLLSHFLEHLPSLADAKRCLLAACMVAREYVYVCQPYFDADGYLFDKGLKLYWSDWTGHPNRMTSLELYCCIRDIASRVPIQRFAIYRRGKITDSHETVIHAVASPVDQHDWQAMTHPEKPPTPFNYPVYKELGALIVLDGNFNELERRAMLKDKLFDSANQ